MCDSARLEVIEKKLDRVMEALGIDPQDHMDLEEAIRLSARTLDYSHIQNFLKRKIEREGSNNGQKKGKKGNCTHQAVPQGKGNGRHK